MRRVSGNEAGVDRSDRRADDPVRLDPGFLQCLIDAHLIGPEGAAALQNEYDLAGEAGPVRCAALRGSRRPTFDRLLHSRHPVSACQHALSAPDSMSWRGSVNYGRRHRRPAPYHPRPWKTQRSSISRCGAAIMARLATALPVIA